MLNGVVLSGSRIATASAKKTTTGVMLTNGDELQEVCAHIFAVPFHEEDEVASVSPFHFVNTSVLLKSPVFVSCTKKQLAQHAFIGTVTYVEQMDDDDVAEEDEEEEIAAMSSGSEDENSDVNDEHENIEDIGTDDENISDFDQ